VLQWDWRLRSVPDVRDQRVVHRQPAGLDRRQNNLRHPGRQPGIARAGSPWLSDGNITPAGTVLLAAGPSTRFTLVDGTPVANSRAELASGTLRHAINLTESGAAGTSNPGQVWTNALPSGEAAGTASGHCAGWTSEAGGSGNTGEATSVTQSWTTGTSAACSEYRRLYCFQFA
jgi:hypothetical protein